MSTTILASPRHLNFDAVSEASTDGDDQQVVDFLQGANKGKNLCNSPPTKNNKVKSSLCRNFSEKGYCPYGHKCQFAHGLAELRCNIDQNSYKTKPCNSFWKKGYCPYGFRCNFSHSISPADAPECKSTITPVSGGHREILLVAKNRSGESRLLNILGH